MNLKIFLFALLISLFSLQNVRSSDFVVNKIHQTDLQRMRISGLVKEMKETTFKVEKRFGEWTKIDSSSVSFQFYKSGRIKSKHSENESVKYSYKISDNVAAVHNDSIIIRTNNEDDNWDTEIIEFKYDEEGRLKEENNFSDNNDYASTDGLIYRIKYRYLTNLICGDIYSGEGFNRGFYVFQPTTRKEVVCCESNYLRPYVFKINSEVIDDNFSFDESLNQITYNPDYTPLKLLDHNYSGSFDLNLSDKTNFLADWADFMHNKTLFFYNQHKNVMKLSRNFVNNSKDFPRFAGGNFVYKYDDHGNWIKAMMYNQESGALEGISERHFKYANSAGDFTNEDDFNVNDVTVKDNDSINNENPATNNDEGGDKIDETVEKMPKFPGGEHALFKYIADHTHYPSVSVANGAQGRCLVCFVISKDGTVGDVQLLSHVDAYCDREAVRVIKSLPRFIPGRINDKPINVKYTVPIRFRLPK